MVPDVRLIRRRMDASDKDFDAGMGDLQTPRQSVDDGDIVGESRHRHHVRLLRQQAAQENLPPGMSRIASKLPELLEVHSPPGKERAGDLIDQGRAQKQVGCAKINGLAIDNGDIDLPGIDQIPDPGLQIAGPQGIGGTTDPGHTIVGDAAEDNSHRKQPIKTIYRRNILIIIFD